MSEHRIQAEQYVVYPAGYDEMVHSDKDMWCLVVTNGRRWGWYISRGRGVTGGGMAMNRHGDFIFESRGSGHNKPRRWPLEEALMIAERHVDSVIINGYTAQEASDNAARRLAASS